MSLISRSLLASTAIILSTSFPAFSQQLAEEVIAEYFSEASKGGITVDPGIKTVSGKTVEWRDVVFNMPKGAGQMTWEFIRAEEIGDGKVAITYPEVLNTKISAKGDVPEMDITVTLVGVEHIISGTKTARRNDFAADTVVYNIAADGSKFSMIAELSNLAGKQINTGDEDRHYSGNMSASDITLSYNLADDDMVMAMQMAYADLAIDFEVDSVTEENFGTLLNGTRNITMNYSIGSGNTMTDIKQPDFSGVINATADGGAGTLAIVDGIFKLFGTGTNASYELKFTEIPLPPFQASIDSFMMNMEMPLKKADEVLPVNYALSIDGLKASDTLWGMVDPTGSLPRDKAALNIDLTANMKWLVDLIMIEGAPGMPAEVQNVTINNITLDVAGARLEGQGSAVIDNSKFPPEPVGTVDLDLKGGIGLLDKLVALGLVPQEQGQMAKMFSGMFAVPGDDGPDHLTSKIEMKEGGSILVNGNQVK